MTAHRHPYDDDPRCTEVGPTVCLRPTIHGDDEHLAGFIVAYDWPGSGVRLEGAVSVDPHLGSVLWSMTGSLEGGDLTLSPSIQAYDSRDPSGRKATIHGYVTNGAWVPVPS